MAVLTLIKIPNYYQSVVYVNNSMAINITEAMTEHLQLTVSRKVSNHLCVDG